MKETRIPTRADQPPQLLLWSADECLPVLLGLGLGIMINQVFVCTLLDETPLSLDSADIYCHILDDAGFPNVVPFRGIVVVTPVSNFTGDGFYVNWRNQDECLSLRRLVRSDSAPATLFSYHSWNAKPETLTLTLSSHDFEYYGKVLEFLPRNGEF